MNYILIKCPLDNSEYKSNVLYLFISFCGFHLDSIPNYFSWQTCFNVGFKFQCDKFETIIFIANLKKKNRVPIGNAFLNLVSLSYVVINDPLICPHHLHDD